MQDAELDNLNNVVAKAAAGITTISKHEPYTKMKAAARRLARDGETAEKAFCRLYVERNAPYASIYRAYSARPGTSTIAKATMYSGDVDDGDGMADDADSSGPSFSAQVDAHQQRNPTMTRSASIDSCMATRAGRSALALEKRKRLARAMGAG
jgi:hypothetical protein